MCLKVNLPDVSWSNQAKTLILALNKGCHFCNESAPFYKRLVESVQNKNVKLIAVFLFNIEESRTHLKEFGITGIDIKQSPLSALRVSGTPTLILTNEKGEITDYACPYGLLQHLCSELSANRKKMPDRSEQVV
ncbi:MAG: hypothetical protein H0U87_10210 [Acidobacteria bacterium]|nr:hypothetical protein [Acidobacteriota bacterium]